MKTRQLKKNYYRSAVERPIEYSSALQYVCGAELCSTMRHNSVVCNTVQYSAVLCSDVRCSVWLKSFNEYM